MTWVSTSLGAVQHPIGSEEFIVCVCSLRDAVCIHKEAVAGVQLERMLFKGQPVHGRQRQRMAVGDQFVQAAGPAQGGVFVSGIDSHALAG